ncbi:MAG: acylphosphatase [Chloroflexi bacterium]|nr:acylphosphatase [Chloroflexota bacterium]
MSVNSHEIETVGVTVHGRVQGVGFRMFVASIADRLNVSGWVKNLPDGSVQLQATAPRQVLDALITAVGLGPRGSHIERVETRTIEAGRETPASKSEGFEIL